MFSLILTQRSQEFELELKCSLRICLQVSTNVSTNLRNLILTACLTRSDGLFDTGLGRYTRKGFERGERDSMRQRQYKARLGISDVYGNYVTRC